MKRRTPLRLFLLILLFVFLTGILNTTQADIEVHFLDVGQGDAILIVCDGEAMLIDGGGRPADSSSMRISGSMWLS